MHDGMAPLKSEVPQMLTFRFGSVISSNHGSISVDAKSGLEIRTRHGQQTRYPAGVVRLVCSESTPTCIRLHLLLR